jgi:hypothetical protein
LAVKREADRFHSDRLQSVPLVRRSKLAHKLAGVKQSVKNRIWLGIELLVRLYVAVPLLKTLASAARLIIIGG